MGKISSGMGVTLRGCNMRDNFFNEFLQKYTEGVETMFHKEPVKVSRNGSLIGQSSVRQPVQVWKRNRHSRSFICGKPCFGDLEAERRRSPVSMMPFNQALGYFTVTLTIDVESTDGIDRATLRNKVKETIGQIWANLMEEYLE